MTSSLSLKWLGFWLAFLGSLLPVDAQKKGIYLQDPTSGDPLTSAYCTNRAQSFSLHADTQGYIELGKDMLKKNDSILLVAPGFESQWMATAVLEHRLDKTISLQKKHQELSEVIVSASIKKNIFETISQMDIRLRPINNSQEVLRIVPGLFLGQHAGGGKAEQLFLRGFDLDHGTDIRISADGIPVNMVSHAHGQGYADLHFLIPEIVEKVDFNKGPYEIKQGNFATTGYVNFKTKDVLTRSFLQLEGGFFSTARALVGWNILPKTWRTPKQQHDLYIVGEGYFSEGYFGTPQDFSRLNGIVHYHTRFGKGHTLTALLSGFHSQWKNSAQIPNRALEKHLAGFYGSVDDNEGGKTSRYNASLSFSSPLKNGTQFTHLLYYSHYAFDLNSNFTFFKTDPLHGDQIRQQEQRNLFGYQGEFTHTFTLWGLPMHTQLGIQWRTDLVEHIGLAHTMNRQTTLGQIALGNIAEVNAGGYYGQTISFSKKLELNAGLRVDYFYNSYEDAIHKTHPSSVSFLASPKLHLSYQVNKNAKLYLYGGMGFHSNDTRIVVQKTTNKAATPVWGTDLGGVFTLGKNILLQAAVWYLWVEQEYVYLGDDGRAEPSGETQRWGVDLSVRYEVVRHWYLSFDGNFALPRMIGVPEGKNYIPLAPLFNSSGGIAYRQSSGFSGSLLYRYMADRPANNDYSFVAVGYVVLDAQVNYTHSKWEAGLSIQNVLNTQWKESQAETESQLKGEAAPVSDIHFTPGTPFALKLSFRLFF